MTKLAALERALNILHGHEKEQIQMTRIAIGQSVTLVKYEPGPNNAPGKAVEYAATVIGVERVNNSDVPHLHLAFLHSGRLGVLSGADWRNAFDRVFSVPHEDAVENQSFFYRDDASDLRDANDDLRDINAGLEMELAAEKLKYAESTEGKDEALQATADAGASKLPSAEDLDAVAEEEKVKAATAAKS